MLRYLGIFLIVTSLTLRSNKKKSDKGKETWESKHNINIKKWWYVSGLIIGFILLFGSNFHANITLAAPEGEEVLYSFGENEVDSTANDNVNINDIMGYNEVNADENFVNDDMTDDMNVSSVAEKEAEIQNIVDEEEISEKNETNLVMNDGLKLTLNTPEGAEVYDEHDTNILISLKNDCDISYMDSFIKVDDEELILHFFQSAGIKQDEISTFTVDDKTIYAGELYSEFGTHRVYILQDLGSRNYLSIILSDYQENDITTCVEKSIVKIH